jgi:hypothetical protein
MKLRPAELGAAYSPKKGAPRMVYVVEDGATREPLRVFRSEKVAHWYSGESGSVVRYVPEVK